MPVAGAVRLFAAERFDASKGFEPPIDLVDERFVDAEVVRVAMDDDEAGHNAPEHALPRPIPPTFLPLQFVEDLLNIRLCVGHVVVPVFIR